MTAADLDSMLKLFTRTEQNNDKAVEIITEIAQSKISTQEQRVQLLNSLGNMTRSYNDMVGLLDGDRFKGRDMYTYIESVRAKYDSIEKRLSSSIMASDPNADGVISFQLSPHIFSHISKWTVDEITTVNPVLFGENQTNKPTLNDVRTSHDLVRYIHQNSLELLFNPEIEWSGNGFEKKSINDGSKLTLNLIPLKKMQEGEQGFANPFLEHLVQIVKNQEFVNIPESHSIYALYDANNLNLNLPLGCHVARLVAKKQGQKYHVSFKFVDTIDYKTSKFRTAFTKKALKYLGYEVSAKRNVVKATQEFDEPLPAMTLFEGALRLAHSLKNLDNYEAGMVQIKKREKDLFRAFFSGVMALRSYLESYSHGEHNQYMKEKHHKPTRKNPDWKPLFPEYVKTLKFMTEEKKAKPAKGLIETSGGAPMNLSDY